MQRLSNKEQSRQRSIPIITYAILGLVIMVAFGMPVFQSKYIHPRFTNLIIENTESEAIRIARHMMRVVLQDYSDKKFILSEVTRTYLDHTRDDYNLWKAKVFSKSGEIIYSTSKKEVGKLNEHSYFHEIVAKGQVYTKVVQKNAISLEGQIVTNDVVETYIPIMENGRFIGAFELYYNISDRKKNMDTIITQTNLLLYGLTGIILIVVLGATLGLRRRMKERKRFEDTLYSLASKDSLTCIYNRRRFTELLEWELVKYARYQKHASLLMFDIDHFKSVNDTYGHQAGDDVLIAVVETCKHILRKSDLMARYGGEEFVVLMTETERSGAIEVAEKLRQSVAELITPCAGSEIRVTISIGVVDFCEVQELSFDTVIKLADECLYKAKNLGRNQVCTSD